MTVSWGRGWMCWIYSEGKKVTKTNRQADTGQETRREWWWRRRRDVVNRSRHSSVQSRCISMSAGSVLWRLQTRRVAGGGGAKNKVFGREHSRRARCSETMHLDEMTCAGSKLSKWRCVNVSYPGPRQRWWLINRCCCCCCWSPHFTPTSHPVSPTSRRMLLQSLSALIGSLVWAETRGGRRRPMAELRGKPSCSNRENLRRETRMSEPQADSWINFERVFNQCERSGRVQTLFLESRV